MIFLFRVGKAAAAEERPSHKGGGPLVPPDVLDLIQEVRRIVKEKTGYTLEPEVRVTGGEQLTEG